MIPWNDIKITTCGSHVDQEAVRQWGEKINTEEQSRLLNRLDVERQTVVYPGVTRHSDRGAIREVSADGKNCEIVYSSCSGGEVDQVIDHQVQGARRAGYGLEWKLYGHDRPQCLGERLAAAGFRAGAREAFMVFSASDEAVGRFGVCSSDIRRVTDREGLADCRTILEEVRGRNCEKEIAQYASLLESHPYNLSIYVGYVAGEPATTGRVYFHESSRFATLHGGNTRGRFRRRGLYTETVAARIWEALGRGIVNVCVDALPTSEPILRKRGFETLTHTQPFFWAG